MKISELKVMKSNACYYIGRSYYDEDCGCDLPYSRESDYYPTKEACQLAWIEILMIELAELQDIPTPREYDDIYREEVSDE